MAIDSFIIGDSPRDELIRSSITPILPQSFKLRTLSGDEPFSADCPCRVPRGDYDSMTIALIELTFRYAAKVIVAVACDDLEYSPINYSIAEKCIENMKETLPSEYCSEIVERYEYASMKILEYIDSGDDSTENIIRHCWFLAKLDVCYRKDAYPRDVSMFFTPAEPEISRELFDMLNIFRTEFLPKVMTPESSVVFNPNFGYAERLVCETDCDIIIDNTLIDLRTDSTLSYPKAKLLKELTYIMMTQVNKRCGQAFFELDRILFFNPRFAETEILALDDIPTEKYNNAVEKMMIVTEARYKKNNTASIRTFELDMKPDAVTKFSKRQEPFIDDSPTDFDINVDLMGQPKNKLFGSFSDTMDISGKPLTKNASYTDGYTQTYTEETTHRKKPLIRKLTSVIIAGVIVIVAVLILQKVITDNFGNYNSFTDILKKLFGGS